MPTTRHRRVTPKHTSALLGAWHTGVLAEQALFPAQSFDLDFHSVPYHGAHPSIERHYVSKCSRRQSNVLVFLAQDADARAFCYADANLRKGRSPKRYSASSRPAMSPVRVRLPRADGIPAGLPPYLRFQLPPGRGETGLLVEPPPACQPVALFGLAGRIAPVAQILKRVVDPLIQGRDGLDIAH